MNTKVGLGILVCAVVLVGGFFLLHKPTPQTTIETPSSPSTTAPAVPTKAATSTKPTFTVTGISTTIVHTYVRTDAASLVSTSTHPTITGTANVSRVGIVIKNSADVGIVGSSAIVVRDGHWSYAIPISLSPGSYTLFITGAENMLVTTLKIKAP